MSPPRPAPLSRPPLQHRLLNRSPRERAYVLPLATGAAGLLLLIGLTLHSMALQERLQVNALERLRREEDLLASAAHQLLAALNGPHRCLVSLPLARWELEGAACASPGALAALQRMEVWAVPVRLLAWRPTADGTAEMELQLEKGGGHGPRFARFGARLTGTPPQAIDPRARDLGGALP